MPAGDWGLMGLSRGLAQGASNLGMGLVRGVEHALPTNIGAFVGTLVGDRAPITNQNLSQADMVALQRAAADAMALHQSPSVRSGDGKWVPSKDTILGYPDYPTSHADVDSHGWLDTLLRSFTDPGYRMETTIGAARLHPDAQGNVHVIDTYDFNRDGPGARILNSENPLAAAVQLAGKPTKVLDALGYLAAPDSVSDRRPVDINLGRIKPAYLGETSRGLPRQR